jgi:hypothetical protein
MPEESEISPQRKLELAYLDVFGPPDKRSAHQRLVWADLEGFCYAHRLVSEGQTDGELAINRAIFNDGRRSYWLRARGQVINALAAPKAAPKVSLRKPPTKNKKP